MSEEQKLLSTEQAILKTMQTPKGRKNAFLCYYEQDVSNAYKRFSSSEEWHAVQQLLSKYIPPSRNTLDLGAGNGIGSFALQKSGYSVTSLEPDPSELVGYGAIIKYQKSNNILVSPVSGIGEFLPFKNQSFGVVYCRQVLHHASDLNRIVKEIFRVLIPGGIFFATREHVVDDQESMKIFLENHPLHKHTHVEGAFTLDEYIKALKNSNFEIVQTLLSWDSVINHYPISNSDVKLRIRKNLLKEYGRLGKSIPLFPPVVNYCRKQLSYSDTKPGRMVSFITKKR